MRFSTGWIDPNRAERIQSFLPDRHRPWRSYRTQPKDLVAAKKPIYLYLVHVDQGTSEQERTFEALAEKWKRETRHVSSITRTSMHPAYQQIIGMGEPAVRFILRDFEANGGHWLWALHAITREDPAQEGDDFDSAVKAWLNWGRKKGYI